MARKTTTARSSDPAEIVRKLLTREKRAFKPLPGGGAFLIELEDELYDGALAVIHEDERRFSFYVDFKQRAPAATRAEVAEMLTRANYGILIGNFEMDLMDGTVRYKSSLDYGSAGLTEELASNAMSAAMDSLELYGHAVAEVIAGKKPAKKALKDAERAP